jgi:hypothetical protein
MAEDADPFWSLARRLARLAAEDLDGAWLDTAADDVGRAHVLFHAGRFVDCEAALDRIEAAKIDSASAAFASLVRGCVSSVRNDLVTADDHFARAGSVVAGSGSSAMVAVLRAVRSEMLAAGDPDGALGDAEAALADAHVASDPTWRSWAIRGQALARAANGAPRRDVLEPLLAIEPQLTVESARCLLVAGELEVERDPKHAAERVATAAATFRTFGARYWEARSLRILSRVRPGASASSRRRADRLDLSDAAYELLRAPSHCFEVRVLGAPAVLIDDQLVEFPTARSELLVYMLAVAGPAGVHTEVVAERLWPEADPNRSAASLRTALWQARRALGSEAWRLSRRRALLTLDLADRPCDLVEIAATLRRDDAPIAELRRASAQLEQPVLSPWRFEEWVSELDDERTRLADRAARLLDRGSI